MTVVWLGQSVRPLAVKLVFISNWFFGAHNLWKDTLLSLDTGSRALGLPHLDMPDFVDSPWEALHFLRSGWGGIGEVVGAGGGEMGNCSWYVK